MTDEEIALDRNQPLPARIASGARIWSRIQAQNSTLELLKADLRVEALRSQATNGEVVLGGEGWSQARIVFPPRALRLRKNTDPSAFRTLFGKTFPLLFEETKTWQLKTKNPEMVEGVLRRLPKALQEVLFKLVEEPENTPRVYFESVGDGVEKV